MAGPQKGHTKRHRHGGTGVCGSERGSWSGQKREHTCKMRAKKSLNARPETPSAEIRLSDGSKITLSFSAFRFFFLPPPLFALHSIRHVCRAPRCPRPGHEEEWCVSCCSRRRLLLTTPGKNWHAAKKPFRPGSGMTSYAKRAEDRKHQEAIKEHEREMKEEKESERQVRDFPIWPASKLTSPGPYPEDQGPASRQGGEGAL